MHILLFSFVILCVLFRREMRALILVMLLLFGAASIYTVNFWSHAYNNWVACGSPQTGVCPDE